MTRNLRQPSWKAEELALGDAFSLQRTQRACAERNRRDELSERVLDYTWVISGACSPPWSSETCPIYRCRRWAAACCLR